MDVERDLIKCYNHVCKYLDNKNVVLTSVVDGCVVVVVGDVVVGDDAGVVVFMDIT